jgi:hypothetical protein
MAVRLHLKYGLVAEQDRLGSSPDTVLVTEPTIGSVLRSKGNLYTVVTARAGAGARALEATALVAETVRREYYYDESAGIPICLEKALRNANRRLRHQREGHGLGRGEIGAVVAVVRGHELYVATIGDGEAYLVRQARLLTLPEEDRGEGLPTPDELRVDVWRGELAVGDSLLLVARNLTRVVGTEELKNAVVTLHPQSAVEHLHHLFVAGGGDGSDAVLAVEATEIAATRSERKLVPVRPAEPLAGAPERSPIPLADPVVNAAAAVSGRARRARAAIGDAFFGLLDRLTDFLPRRRTRYRRVTPLATRRESQRRAAIALLGFLAVVGTLGLGAWVLGGVLPNRPDDVINAANAAEQALQTARQRLGQVESANLVTSDRERALRLLREAWTELGKAEQAGVKAAQLRPVRDRVLALLDRIYQVRAVASTVVYDFTKLDAAAGPIDELVIGPDGRTYSIDRASKSVVRVSRGVGSIVARMGDGPGDGMAEPWFLARGGPDLVIMDKAGGLWRWRPSDQSRGTLGRIRLTGDASWGDDVVDLGTFIRNEDAGLYNAYVVDPSSQQILRYQPTLDGGALAGPTNYLATASNVGEFKQVAIDGDLYALTPDGVIRHESGRADTDFALADLPDAKDLRPGHEWGQMAITGAEKQGRIYVWDERNLRIVAFAKSSGEYLEQFVPGGQTPRFEDVRGMVVVDRPDGQSPLLVWVSGTRLLTTPLEAAAASPSPGASGSPAPSGASPGASAGAVPSP